MLENDNNIVDHEQNSSQFGSLRLIRIRMPTLASIPTESHDLVENDRNRDDNLEYYVSRT
jgi:hypothetical protein